MKRATILAAVLLLALSPVRAQQPAGAADAGKSSRPDVLKDEQFSDAVANALLSRIADGFTRRNPRLLLSAFDARRFDGYALFADRMRARLEQHDSFRAYFRILDTTPQDARAMVNVELQVEQSYSPAGRPPVRSSGQARFTFERGAAGWRIVDVAPRGLLTGGRGPA